MGNELGTLEMAAVIAVALLMLAVALYGLWPAFPSKEDERKELEFLISMSENEAEFNKLISRYGRLERGYWKKRLADFLGK